MKIKIEKSLLKNILEKVQSLTNNKTSFPITKNIIIEAKENNCISFLATNLISSFYAVKETEVQKKGKIALNALKLFEIVKFYPDTHIEIEEIDDQWIKIGQNDVIYNIVGVIPDDFPDVMEEYKIDENYEYIEIDGNEIKKGLSIANLSNYEEHDSKPFITGFYLGFIKDNEKNISRMYSTNRASLTKYDIYMENDILEKFSNQNIVIPKNIIQSLNAIITDSKIKLTFTEKNLIIKQDHEYFCTSLYENKFPDCNAIFNTENFNLIKLNKTEFTDILKRMSIIVEDKNPIVFFKFSDNNLLINTSNHEIGESKEESKIDYQGEEIKTSFNPKIILKFIKYIEEENLLFYIKDNKSNCIIKGMEDNNYTFTLMPMVM